MNNPGKFLVSALLLHAANIKKLGDTQQSIPVPTANNSTPVTTTPRAS